MALTPGTVEVRDLGFRYPDGTAALSGLSLSVAAGERVAVLGPNGAGKTTLALHLNGVLPGDMGRSASTGSVWIGGSEVGKATLRECRRRVGIVFQDPDDQLFMPTVADDVAFGPANLGYRDG
ncbi:MAG: ABC transporter ATP-binding protein, partial [Acidimicrobiia bacterium]|nr:ABC transporter ATP-binding protein [Acidimicrobiia bacterium]